MIKYFISFCLILFVNNHSFCQTENISRYSVGFKYFKTIDNSRNYIIKRDTVKRPMLIHFWYPSNNLSDSNYLTFKDYVDLIAIREDFEKEQQDIDDISYNFINAYLGFAKQQFGIDSSITIEHVLYTQVKAIYDIEPVIEEFPLIIYAPSNSKSAVQNHVICENLASNGYYVVSVGSAGHQTLKRNDQRKATLAQVRDMEFIKKYISDTLKIKISKIGLLGFSTGSMATIVYQMKNPEVKAVISFDGSHEYAFYPILNTIEGFSIDKANIPYLLIANKYKDFSVFPYYSSILLEDKYLYNMTEIDHNGFISYWKQFAIASKGSIVNSTTKSYDVLCNIVNSFFENTLKSKSEKLKEFVVKNSELIQRDSADYFIMAQWLNLILQEGIDSSIDSMKSNEELYKGKANMINIVGRMFLGNKNEIAVKIFKVNTEIHPDSWEGFYNMAIAFKESNKIEAAKVAITKAKDINISNKDIQNLYDEILQMNVE